jgi:hypothetical protein
MKLVMAILILQGTWAVGQGSAPANSQSGGDCGKNCASTVRMVRVVRPNIVVYGSYLSRVEIWVEPTGTEVGESVVGEPNVLVGPGPRKMDIRNLPIDWIPSSNHGREHICKGI